MPYRALLAQRRLEWWLAAYTSAWGVFVVALPSAFDGAPYLVMAIWAPPQAWGCTASVVGMFHLWALFINGRRDWSAHVRAVATIANTAVFTLALAAMIAAVWHGLSPINATVASYVAPVWAGVCAFWIAARDSYEAMQRRGWVNGC